MADTKISGLAAASALDGTEEFAVVQGGASKKATAAQIAASGPAWTAYTPTFTAATTNPTLGNFTRTGRYVQEGKKVTFVAIIVCNTAAGLGSGAYAFGLPVTARSSTAAPNIGDEVVVSANQSTPTHSYTGRGAASVTEVNLWVAASEAICNVTNSGMTTGTVIRISGTYEAA